MSAADAARTHLLDKLRRHDPDVAKQLSDNLDASLLKRRLGELRRWATGWRKWIWIIAIAVGLGFLAAPVATERIGEGGALGGMGWLMGITAMGIQWRRKCEIYELLTILADPEFEAETNEEE